MYPTMFRIPYLPEWLADIKSYGVMMTIAFLSGIWMACRRADRSKANADIVLNMGFIALICGVAGARAMFVLHYWDTRFATQSNPFLAIFDIRAGGLEFWGGPLLTIPALGIYLRYMAKASVRWYLDITAPSLAWGLAITRIGCFLNGCCWGAVCVDHKNLTEIKAQYPWAVRFPYGSAAMVQQYRFGQLTLPKELIYLIEPVGEGIPLPADWIQAAVHEGPDHRRQLEQHYQQAFNDLKAAHSAGTEGPAYQAAKEKEQAARATLSSYSETMAGRVDLHCRRNAMTLDELAQLANFYRSRPVHPAQLYETISALLICWLLIKLFYYRRRHGIVLPWFLILYSISRVLHEAIRQDNPLDVGGLTISQAISAGTFLAGVFWLYIIYTRMPMVSPRVVPFEYPEEPPTATARKR